MPGQANWQRADAMFTRGRGHTRIAGTLRPAHMPYADQLVINKLKWASSACCTRALASLTEDARKKARAETKQVGVSVSSLKWLVLLDTASYSAKGGHLRVAPCRVIENEAKAQSCRDFGRTPQLWGAWTD
ncbi:unnamed protein product [Polarella glacialis]|uniref:Uncharacterized protein n=1 Tax=Polarella glacialis TaxID=89957 RepID=A0A813LQZ7_POLGL|nr:unnamed protein product [Polarella glacialis]